MTNINQATISLFTALNIQEIYPPYIYSIKYDEQSDNEFDRLFDNWNDVNFVSKFMEDHQEYLGASIWQKIHTPEDATRQVLDEAEDLIKLFDELYENTQSGINPDFDTHFYHLEGKYVYSIEWQPMKSYGTNRPSMLRIYAIKMGKNIYLITGGGIKLSRTIQESPDLQDHVLQNIDKVIEFLKRNGIYDSDDLTVNT